MTTGLNGRVAVVTGASGALGSAAARQLAELGATVVWNYNRTRPSADHAFQADVSTAEGAQALIDYAVKELGRLDVLVNNAGITRDGLAMRMSEADWDVVIDTNLKGAFLCAKAALRPMLKQRWGRIVNVTSVAGIMGNPGQANYCAAKAGMIGFTKSIAKEFAARNITSNAVAPGFIKTDMTANLPAEAGEKLMSVIPLKRLGEAADIAHMVAFLCSEEAGYITGQVFTVDGGMVM